jgi:Fe2+ transport system protein FeoA
MERSESSEQTAVTTLDRVGPKRRCPPFRDAQEYAARDEWEDSPAFSPRQSRRVPDERIPPFATACRDEPHQGSPGGEMPGGVSPLTLLAAGTEATITRIRGDGGLQMRLSGMGLCPEAWVTIRSANRGSVIVSVGTARYLLSRETAAKVLVRETQEAV